MAQDSDLDIELKRFKLWATEREGTYGEWECDYPEWPSLFAVTERAIDQFKDGNIPDEVADQLLYVVARDNEHEFIRNRLLEMPRLLAKLAKRAISSVDRDARWQIAISIAESDLENAAELVRPFLADQDEYVRRRSLMAFATLCPAEAEFIAIANLNDEFEYTRIAALHVLHTVHSSRLEDFLQRHEFDPSEYVRENVRRIRDALQRGRHRG